MKEEKWTPRDMAYSPGGLTQEDARDAARYRWLQNQDPEVAQAFFWNYKSRKQRSKAIDAAMKEQGDD